MAERGPYSFVQLCGAGHRGRKPAIESRSQDTFTSRSLSSPSLLFQSGFSIENTDGTVRIQLLGLVFAGLMLLHGISRLLTRPNGSALWKPATFEKVDKAFALGLVDTVLACSSLTLASSISFLLCLLDSCSHTVF